MSVMDKIAINTAIFDGHDLKISLKTIRELGISKVEFAFNQGYVGQLDDDMFSSAHAQHLNGLLSKEGLRTDALGCTMSLAHKDTVELFKMRIRFAAELGVNYLNTCTGPASDWQKIVDNLSQLAPYAEQHDCIICIENGGDVNFNAFASLEHGVQMLNEIGHDAVAINFDPGNSVSLVPNLSPSKEAKDALPFCRHFHVKDVAVNDDSFTFPALGQGIINYPELLRLLDQRDIPFSIEKPLRMFRRKDTLPVRDRTPVSLDEIKSVLQQSLTYIQRSCDLSHAP